MGRDRGARFGALAIGLFLACTDPALSAGRRIALVIGNSDYEHTSSLPNPANDARLIANVLETHGFEVLKHINIDLKRMKRAIAEMANKTRAYGRNSVAVLYYAGHGVQVGQTNYLIPVDAKIDSEGDVAIEGLNVASILESLSDAGATVNVVILDACRNNPYRTSFRSAARGLARIDGPPGFLIAFSTDPGKVATDGPSGGNSPYTQALAASFAKPGLKIEEALKQVRKEVFETTRGAQVPWETSSLIEELYVAGRGTAGAANVSTSSTVRPGADTLPSDDETAKAKAEAEAETARAKAEIAKAEAARRKARTEMERAKAESERAAAELAKVQAETELARLQADTARKLADAEALRAQSEAQKRSVAAFPSRDTSSLFNPSAVPSFSCSEYGIKPVGHADRNPQTDVLCIAADAANADYRLGLVFRQYTSGLSAITKRDVIANQKQWILLRNQRCAGSWGDVSVPERRDQIARCLIRETNARILELQR